MKSDDGENATGPQQAPEAPQRGPQREVMQRSHRGDEIEGAVCEMMSHNVALNKRDPRF
jgi:hypothetical protein